MTTNQTIDGVSRELLWKALNGSSKEIAIAQNELRALLDAPVAPVAPCAIADALESAQWPNTSIGNKVLVAAAITELRKAAQPQGEPVACFEKFARDRCPGVYFGKDANGEYMAADARLVLDFWNAGFLAEQPAPVAVVRVCDCNQGRLPCRCKP